MTTIKQKPEITWRTRLLVSVLGYVIVFIFFFAFIMINNIKIFLLSASLEPIAFLLAGLVAAPLVVAFLWGRITSIEIGGVKFGLEQAEKEVSEAPLNQLDTDQLPAKSPQIIYFMKTALRDAERTKLLTVNLGKGQTWRLPYLYLLVALLEDFTSTDQIIFLDNLPDEDIHFPGLVTPSTLRRALAKEYPRLERVYRQMYGSLFHDAEGILQQGRLQRDGITLQGNQTLADFIIELLIPVFLSEFKGDKNPEWGTRMSEELLKRLLGQDLITNATSLTEGLGKGKDESIFLTIIAQVKQKIGSKPPESSVRFFVLLDGKRFIVVDVLELAVNVSDEMLPKIADGAKK